MTRGNQRDTDRARAAKRAEKAGKPTAKDKDGLSALQRRERDAAALAEKIAKKKAEDNGKS
eukprot:CAMPEP_0202899232 /NCGR_PEP_ID=MMETSP1392-20130828/7519_1 /ASSEMBLY_ACC=CAM_ASM_000868 /TAXON_ID=225041 /ORGANISM="Chlamydomonas chlamydogama, Strain SAG 11-48b" /LENGTH=60 /DNA_ID=CAMNT_0049585355 /DNA_START=137 /DNA_END=319 /DNA_ORIENTATION=+